MRSLSSLHLILAIAASSATCSSAFSARQPIRSLRTNMRTTWYNSYVNEHFMSSSSQDAGDDDSSSSMDTGSSAAAADSEKSSFEDIDIEKELEGVDDMDKAIEQRKMMLREKQIRKQRRMSPITGKLLGPDTPLMFKPRPSRYGLTNHLPKIRDEDLVQTMDSEQRKKNLEVLRQLVKKDLPDLKLRRDFAGYVRANNEKERREKRDPWYGLNERLKEATQLGQDDEAERLNGLIDKLGGPPPGIVIGHRGYALQTDIYEFTLSPERILQMTEDAIRERRHRVGLARIEEQKKIAAQEKKNREYKFANIAEIREKQTKEANMRLQKTLRRAQAQLEESNKKKMEKAKEILGKLPDPPKNIVDSVDRMMTTVSEDLIARGKAKKEGVSYEEFKRGKGSLLAQFERQMKERERQRLASLGPNCLPGDEDIMMANVPPPVFDFSKTATGPLTVEVSSSHYGEKSDPPMRKHCFQYTVKITNNSPSETIQLISRRFEIQAITSDVKDVMNKEGVIEKRKPVLKPGEVFEYTSTTGQMYVRPLGLTTVAARMRGEYKYVVLPRGQETATEEERKDKNNPVAELGMFHFIFPDELQVKGYIPPLERRRLGIKNDDEPGYTPNPPSSSSSSTPSPPQPVRQANPAAAKKPQAVPPQQVSSAITRSYAAGDQDMTTGDLEKKYPNDSSDTVSHGVRVKVTTRYDSDKSNENKNQHCFAYTVRITNERMDRNIQIMSRRFEIQTIGNPEKEVLSGAGVTKRQPTLKPGEYFEYTGHAPLSVKPMMEKTPVVGRMQGEYNFLVLGPDGATPESNNAPYKATMGTFHFMLPQTIN